MQTRNLHAHQALLESAVPSGRSYRNGYGCTLANAGRIHVVTLLLRQPANDNDPWPEAPPDFWFCALAYVDYGALDFALTNAFEE